jgi:hypothetical protein
MRTSRTLRPSHAPRRTALCASLAAAALALLPAAAASADTTIQLTEDDLRSFSFFDDEPVTVTPGSTLRVPPPPAGAEWATNFEFVLFADPGFEDFGAVTDELAEDGGTGLTSDAPSAVPDVLPEDLPATVEELEAFAEADELDDEVVVADTVIADPAAPGGVLVVLADDIPAGTYIGEFLTSGVDVVGGYFVSLEITEGDADSGVTLDYTDAAFSFLQFETAFEQTVARGERVTLTAPEGVDFNGFSLEIYLPDLEGELEFPFYLEDELDVTYAESGRSVSFLVPRSLPEQELGTDAGSLPDDTAFEVGLFALGDETDTSFRSYVVTGLTVGGDSTSPATTRPPIPTAVPAGEGAAPRGGPDLTAVVAAALAGATVLGAGGLLLRRRAGAGTHR